MGSIGTNKKNTMYIPARRTMTLLLFASSLLAGCGWGSATLASSSGGSSSSNAQPVGSTLSVQRSATSPATIRFQLVDQERNSSTVDLRYRSGNPGSSFEPITLDPASNPLTGVPSDSAMEYEVLWDFAADLGDESFHSDIELELTIIGGVSPPILTDVELGNDAPALLTAELFPVAAVEYEGIVDLVLTVSDTSSDPLDIRVEYRLESELDSAFRTARSTTLRSDLPSPGLAFESVESSAAGTEYTFRWESAFVANPAELDPSESQLPGRDVRVVFRATVCDVFSNTACDPEIAEAALPGSTRRTTTFRVDNNRPPLAILEEASFNRNPDQNGAISVPLRLFDDESDPLRVIVQWRLEGESFPLLESTTGIPLGAAELLALLDDPSLNLERRRLQIAREVPGFYTGRVGLLATRTLEDNEVRLPELASSASGLFASGFGGRTLELLRPAAVLEEVVWTGNALNGPVASHLTPSGRSALVLDHDSSGLGWRVRKIDLESGEPLAGSPSATGAGIPCAFAVDPLGTHLFVASSAGMYRFALQSLESRGSAPGNPFSDGPRALAALGTDVVIATGDDKLVRVEFDDSRPPLSSILVDGLSEPWGVLADPLETNVIYLAEAAFDHGNGLPPGRVSAIDLTELCGFELPAVLEDPLGPLGPTPFPSPRALALGDKASQLLVLCEGAGGNTSLRAIELRNPDDLSMPSDGRADPLVFEVTDKIDDARAHYATGRFSSAIVTPATPQSNTVALLGGISQARRISDSNPVDIATQVVGLERAFDPAAQPSAAWRVAQSGSTLRSSPTGALGTFVWDSAEVHGFAAQLRVHPIDNDLGTDGTGMFFRPVDDGYVETKLELPGVNNPGSLSLEDMNGDGALDLVYGDLFMDTISIVFQTSAGEFSSTTADRTLITGGDLWGIAVADLNCDGALDVVSADGENNTLSVFFQDGPGIFSTVAADLTLRTGDDPRSVIAADLNGDGALDLISGDALGASLSIFFQRGSGSFNTISPDLILSIGFAPQSVLAGDLNGDGALDLVAVDFASDALAVFLQSQAGGFSSSQPDLMLPTGQGPVDAIAADLNGDGALDLASANSTDRTLSVFFQTGPGNFNTTMPDLTLLPGPFSFSSPIAIEACDVNQDGALDLLSRELNFGDISVFLQFGPQGFNTAAPDFVVPGSGTGSTFNQVATADLDGDGMVDVLAPDRRTTSAPATLSIHHRVPPGTYSTGSPDQILPVGKDPRYVVSADLNGDGALDVASADASGGTLSLYFQSGSASFDPTSPDLTITTGGGTRALAAADLNGDGAVDLASADVFSAEVSIFFQSGAGSFNTTAPDLTLPRTGTPSAVAAADVNGDGAVDLIVASLQTSTLSIFFQSNAGSFNTLSADLTLPSPSGPTSVSTADLNHDGALDIVSGNVLSDTLSVFYQTGAGSFNTSGADVTVPTGRLPSSVAPADLNNDGLLDLLVGINDGIEIYYQNTAGCFSTTGASLILPAGGQITQATAADLNGDGRLDILSAAGGGAGVSVFFQSISGQFNPVSPDISLSVNAFTVFPTVADINGDRSLDIVYTDESSNTLAIYFNSN